MWMRLQSQDHFLFGDALWSVPQKGHAQHLTSVDAARSYLAKLAHLLRVITSRQDKWPQWVEGRVAVRFCQQ